MPDILTVVQDRKTAAEENQRTKFERFNEFDYIYHSKLKYDDPDIPSKVFNPVAWSFIETVVTRMLAANPQIAFKPREETDQVQGRVMGELFNYWYDKSNVYPTMVNWVKDALIYGTGIVKVDWYTSPLRYIKRYQTDQSGLPAMQTQINPETGEEEPIPEFAIEEIPVQDYDDPRLKNVNIYDFFIDPTAKTVEDARWVIYRYYTTYKELEAIQKVTENSGEKAFKPGGMAKLKKMLQSGDPDQGQFERERRSANDYNQEVKTEKNSDRVEVWEMWEPDRLVVIAQQEIVLKEGDNPYWHGKIPFIRIVDSLVPHEFWGKGEIEPIEKLIHAVNTVQNQRITNVNRILSPTWKAKVNVDDDELQFVDNGIIHVDDLNDAEMLVMPNVTSTAVEEQNVLYDTMQRSLGVTDYVQGVQTPGQTAKEVEVKTQQANARFAHKVKLFETMGLKELGTFIYQLYQQFVTAEKVVRIVGKDGESWVRITPADITGEFDVQPESESTIEQDSNAEYMKKVNLLQMLAPYFKRTDPMTGMSSGFLNEQEVIRDIISSSGEKDPDRYFIQEQTMNGQQQQIPGESPFSQIVGGNDINGGMEAMAGQNFGGLL
jgi:hypothetical protein